jgi:hypothetical protein
MKTDGTPFQVRTGKPAREDAIPRQPHERDESEDSQESGPRDVIRQAFIDVTNGQVDTDLREQRGVEEVVKAQPEKSREAVADQPTIAPETKKGRT